MTERLTNPCRNCFESFNGERYSWLPICEHCKERIDYEKFLKTADEEGRLVVLPCKVWDTVYAIEDKYYEHLYHTGIQKGHVCRFEYDKEWFAWIYIDGCNKDLQIAYKIRNFNKTVFLTREEAEKALKEMEG